MKFNVQDRIVLDEMVDTFTTAMVKNHHEADLDGKRPIITKQYWFQMIQQVQEKIDNFTTVKALKGFMSQCENFGREILYKKTQKKT